MASQPLTARVAGFIDHLRLNDFSLGPGETGDALALFSGPLAPEADARRRLKVLLASRREEWERFDDLFEAYWHRSGRERQRAKGTASMAANMRSRTPPAWRDHLPPPESGRSHAPMGDGGEAEHPMEGQAPRARVVASTKAASGNVDFRHFTDPDEIALAEQAAYRLARALRHRLSRRHRLASRGTKLDLRRTIRASLSHGGEPIDLRHTAVPDRPVRIVVFLDVSGSMKLYSRFFLQFVRGLVCRWIDADAYLINTKLMRVTDLVREKNSTKAMTRLALMAEGFGGGTKLGESLELFNARYAKQALNSRTVVMILSDGYDTGEAERLAGALAQIKKRARRLVWLNPLLGWRDYKPVTAAMAAALPHIDHFAVANNLDSLLAIEPDLAAL